MAAPERRLAMVGKAEVSVNVAVQLTTSTAEDSMAAVSPDGRWIVFVSDRSGNKDLWLRPADPRDSSPPRQLTDHTATDTSPCWSPNGKKIAFVSTRNDAKGDIFVLTVSSGALERLTDSDTADDHPTWSPDGKDIVFTVTKREEPASLWQLHLKTKAKTHLTQKGGYDAAFSPDGRYLCFTSSRTGQTSPASPTDHIAVLRLRDSREATLTQGPFADGFASWADDGQSIVFTRFADDTNGDGRLSTEDNPSLWRVAFTDFLFDTLASAVSPPPEPLQLTSSRFYHIFPQQRAGKLYFTSNRNNNVDLWAMPAEGDVPSLPTLAEQFKLALKLNQARPPDPYLALVALRNVVQRFPTGDKATLAEARYETGRIFEGLKNPRQALDEYGALTAAYPEAKKFCGLAEVAVVRIKADVKAAEAVKTAIKSLDGLVARYAGEPSVGAAAHLEMGRLYEALKDNVSAVNAYQTILKTYPKQSSDCAQAILRKAAIYKAFGDEAALLDAYLAVLKDYPSEREWGRQAAESVLDLFVKADLPPQEKIAKLRQVVEKYKDVAILPAMAQNRIAALHYTDLTESAQAKREYQKTIDSFPKEPEQVARARFGLARIFYDEQNYEKTLEQYGQVEAAHRPADDEIYRLARRAFIRRTLQKADRELRQRDPRLALKTYRKLIDYDYQILEAHRRAMRCYAMLGEAKKTVDAYKRDVAQQPDNYATHYCLGLARTYLGTGYYDRATKDIQKALDINSQVSYLHQTLGWIYEQKEVALKQKGWLERSLEEYLVALALTDERENPEGAADLLLNVGNGFYNLGNFKKAYEYYRRRLASGIPFDQEKTEAIFYQHFGKAALDQEDYAEAEKHLPKALSIVQALRDVKKEESLTWQAKIADTLGLCYQEHKRYADAAKSFRQALELNQQLGNEQNVTLARRNIAYNLYKSATAHGDPDAFKLAAALGEFEQSLADIEKHGVRETKPKSRGWITVGVEVALGKDKSQAARGFDKPGEQKLIFTYIGKTYEGIHDYAKAIEFYQKKLDLYPKDPKPAAKVTVFTERAIILNQIGSFYYGLHDLEGAQDAFEASLALCREVNTKHGHIVNAANIGRITAERLAQPLPESRIQAVIQLQNEALELVEGSPDYPNKEYAVYLRNNLAALHRALASADTATASKPSPPEP